MASGDTLLQWGAWSNTPPATGTVPAFMDVRNGHSVMDFDDSTNENVLFAAVMPQHYGGATGITVYLHWAMSSAVAGNVDWDVAFERIGDSQQDIDADGFAAANSADNNTVPGTSGHVDITSIAFTDGADMDSVAVGEGFRIKVTRDAVSDTAAGDAELLWVELRET